MCFGGTRHFGDAPSDFGTCDDQLGLTVIIRLGRIERFEEGIHIMTINGLDIEAIGFEAFARVFTLRHICHRIQCDVVGIVNED